MNNETFNITRFGLLLKRDFRSNWLATLGQSLLAIVAFALIFYSFGVPTHNDDYFRTEVTNERIISFTLSMLFLMWAIFASQLLYPMRNLGEAKTYLMLPASNFEKYVSRWLQLTVLFVIAYFACAWLADVLRVAALKYYYPEMGAKTVNLNNIDVAKEIFHPILRAMTIQSFFVLGATYRKKNAFAKTFVTLVAAISIFVMVYNAIVFLFTGNFSWHITIDSTLWNNNLNLISVLFLLIAVFNWTFAYRRFRELDITNINNNHE